MASPENSIDGLAEPPVPASTEPEAEPEAPPVGDSADRGTGDSGEGGSSSPIGVADVEVSVVGGEDSPAAASAGSSLESTESLVDDRVTQGEGSGGSEMGPGVTSGGSGLVEEEDDSELSSSLNNSRYCVVWCASSFLPKSLDALK